LGSVHAAHRHGDPAADPGRAEELDTHLGQRLGGRGIPGEPAAVFLFNKDASDYQFQELASWIPTLGVNYHIGIDGISLLLVMLTTVIGPLAILSSWNAVQDRTKEYYACSCYSRRG